MAKIYFFDDESYVKLDEYAKLAHEYNEAKDQIKELEEELEVKDNLLKIKNNLTGNTEDVPVPIVAAKDIIDNYYDGDIEQIVGHLEVYLKGMKT